MDADLVGALRSRGVTVVTAFEAGMIAKSDEEQLIHATERGCVVYTFNVSDFYRLHSEWVKREREHGGMVLAIQQHYSIGGQLRRMLRLRATFDAEKMRNHVEFLADWN